MRRQMSFLGMNVKKMSFFVSREEKMIIFAAIIL